MGSTIHDYVAAQRCSPLLHLAFSVMHSCSTLLLLSVTLSSALVLMALLVVLSPTNTAVTPTAELDAIKYNSDLACGLTTTATPCHGGDPFSSWMSFVRLRANGTITSVTANWQVPAKPAKAGDSSPSWWYGLQTTDGLGALLQPVLVWNDRIKEPAYEISNAVMDWSQNCSWTTDGTTTVRPGDSIHSSIHRVGMSDYVQSIGVNSNKSATLSYKLKTAAPETTLYFVMEHQASRCDRYPADQVVRFSGVTVEVDNKPLLDPQWETVQWQTACGSKAIVDSPTDLRLVWNSDSSRVCIDGQLTDLPSS